MVFVVLRGFFLFAFLTLEVIDHRLDGDHCPRQNYDAEAPDQDVAEKLCRSSETVVRKKSLITHPKPKRNS